MILDEQLKDLNTRFKAIRESEQKLVFDKGEFDKDMKAVVKELAGVGIENVGLVELLCKARGLE
jgi:hypothetical protein